MVKLSTISRFSVCCAAAMLCGMQGAHGQSQSFFWEPEDPPYEGYPEIGMGVAVSGHTAAVGAPQYWYWEDPDAPNPLWVGLVNVYVANAERTRWTLLTVLHGDDDAFENRGFGKTIAMQGRRLVIASNAALRVYERRLRNFELVDTVMLDDATIPESTPIQFERDVLAIRVQNNSGGSSVRIFRINPRGNAKPVASLSPPGDPFLNRIGGLSLDVDARTLAVGILGESEGGSVLLYQPCGSTWRRTGSVTAPSSTSAGFGSSVALRGNRLVVGAPGEDQELIPEENAVRWGGAAHVYRRAKDRWVHVQRLATNEAAQPSSGLVGFGSEITTNGRYFWITAPYAHDKFASVVQSGPASLYRWSAGHLEFVAHGPESLPGGGIDMTRRYVIEGDIYGSIHQLEGAHVTDLSTMVPTDTEMADRAAPAATGARQWVYE
jgi:hypothetical protein